MPRLIPLNDLFNPANLAKTEEAIGSAVKNNTAFDWYRSVRDAWNSLWPSDRWTISQQGWYPANPTDGLAAEVRGRVPEIGTQDVALIFEEYEAHTGSFFVGGRRFCACWLPTTHESEEGEGHAPSDGAEPPPPEEPCEESSAASLSTCDPVPGAIVFADKLGAAAYTEAGARTAQFYNAMTATLNEALSSSLLSADRNAYGRGSFFATDFMLEELVQLAREAVQSERKIGEMRALRTVAKEVQGRMKRGTTLRQFASMPTATMMHEWGIDAPTARRLKMDVLLEVLEQADLKLLPPTEEEPADLSEDRHQRELRLATSARGTAKPRAAPRSKARKRK
jgi:hypothetical protein